MAKASAHDPVTDLTSGGRLARNTVWNGIGYAVSLLSALAAVPLLLQTFGADRFGVITLAWALIGSFSVLDLGFGWALTRYTAAGLSSERETELAPIVVTYLAIMAAIGVTAATVLVLGAHP